VNKIKWDLVLGGLVFLVMLNVTFAAVSVACAIAVKIFNTFS